MVWRMVELILAPPGAHGTNTNFILKELSFVVSVAFGLHGQHRDFSDS
jgi:hypothetical protein